MSAVLLPDDFWDLIEPFLSAPRPSPRAAGHACPIEHAFGAFCLFFGVAFRGRCYPKSWAAARA